MKCARGLGSERIARWAGQATASGSGVSIARAAVRASTGVPASARKGRASTRGIALAALALALLIAGLWLLSRGDTRGESVRGAEARPTPESPRAAAQAAPAAPADERVARDAAADPGIPDALGAGRAPRPAGERFRGTGELRGHVEVHGDAAFPERWRLVLAPSLSAFGREHAVHRTIEFENGEQEFRVGDLPLAGYDVTAVAEGMNARTQPVLLERGSESPFVNLVLSPAGYVEGRVAEVDGDAAASCPIVLEAVGTGERIETLTDATGRFRLQPVLDGPYVLTVGPPESPLLPARKLSVRAPGISLPAVTLPPLAELAIEVVDERGAPIAGARVRGSGSEGGLIDGETADTGRLLVQHLPPGRYRLSAELEGWGQERSACDVELGAANRVVIRIGR